MKDGKLYEGTLLQMDKFMNMKLNYKEGDLRKNIYIRGDKVASMQLVN